MLLEETARVFFDKGVEVLVGARERVERMVGCRIAVVGNGVVAEDLEDDFEWEVVKFRHGQDLLMSYAG